MTTPITAIIDITHGVVERMGIVSFTDIEELPAWAEGDEVAAAWANEVERRIDALSRGETSARPVEDVIAAARARIGGGAK